MTYSFYHVLTLLLVLVVDTQTHTENSILTTVVQCTPYEKFKRIYY